MDSTVFPDRPERPSLSPATGGSAGSASARLPMLSENPLRPQRPSSALRARGVTMRAFIVVLALVATPFLAAVSQTGTDPNCDNGLGDEHRSETGQFHAHKGLCAT